MRASIPLLPAGTFAARSFTARVRTSRRWFRSSNWSCVIRSSIGCRKPDGSGPDEAVEREPRRLVRACPFLAAALRVASALGRATCGNEPVAPGADAAAGSASREPGTLSAAYGRHRARPGRFHPRRLTGALGLRSFSGAIALLVALPLAGCEADHIGARATLQEWGYSGIGISAAPAFSRPCRWGEPYAVRFTAHDERGAVVSGWICSTDEGADDACIALDEVQAEASR